MVLLKEFYRRAFEGPIATEKERMHLSYLTRLEELAKEHDIVQREDELIPTDPGIADSIFEAGMELFLERGLWYEPTRRVIKFTPEEVKEGQRNSPRELSFGEGKDRVTIKRRESMRAPPINGGGPWGMGMMSPQQFLLIHQSHAQENIDLLINGPLCFFNGKRVKIGSPAEVMAAAQGARLLREVARRVDRPGMPISFDCQAMSDIAHTSIACPGGARPTDLWTLLPTIPDSKIMKMNLNKIAFSNLHGIPFMANSSPIVYGFSGGAVTSAIAGVADSIGLQLLDGCGLVTCLARDTYGTVNSHDVLWTENASTLALSRNIGGLTLTLIKVMAGPCTEQIFPEITVSRILRNATRASLINGALPTYGVHNEHSTGLESRFSLEVNEAIADINSLSEANELARPIFDTFKDKLMPGVAPKGRPFQELYDLETVTPSDEYLKLYAEAKRELEDMGIPFK